MSKTAPKLLLASASSRRLDLLRQMGIIPDDVIAADIDEAIYKGEKPKNLALRLSQEKATALKEVHPEHFILAADTVVACGQNILDKAENPESAKKYLQKLSGRRHQVHGGISLLTPEGRQFSRHCKTMVQFKPLTPKDIENYIGSGEWEGKAGGYAIQGFAGSFVKHMAGSYSNVVGLSLYDTIKILESGKFDR